MEKIVEGFFDTYSDDFFEYFDQHLVLKVMKEEEYKEKNSQISKLKEKNPNVMAFLEDKENVDLSYEDQNAINEILKLQRELNDIEIKESFKLGFKEVLIFLESMDMLYYKNEDK